jgi:hypothetical protein
MQVPDCGLKALVKTSITGGTMDYESGHGDAETDQQRVAPPYLDAELTLMEVAGA